MFENIDQPQHKLHWQSRHVWKHRSTSTWTTLTILSCLKKSNNLNMNYIDNLAMFVNAVHRILTEHILNCFVKKPCGYFCR